MRRKLKKQMNKDEGFTLVELLAVIAILAIIMAIAVPSIGNVIGKSKTKAEAAEIELIEDAARLAIVSSNIEVFRTSYIYVDVLVESGYLNLNKDNRGGLKENDGAVKISEEGKKYTYLGAPEKINATDTISLLDLNNSQ